MEFSGAVKLTDLNDYINPQQSCSITSSQIRTDKNQTAKITLSDCLACSGCITSAETVLLEKNCLEEFVKLLEAGEKIIVSVSPQSLVVLGSVYQMEIDQVYAKLITLFKDKGVQEVYNMTQVRDLVLQASAQEYIQRREQGKLPVLCSECPGWVCFAEKKADQSVISLLSNIKTPMQILKALHGDNDVKHVSFMPCHDKKLEGAGDDSTDLVLTTNELISLIDSSGVNFSELPLTTSESFYSPTSIKSSSLGYAEYILRQAALQIFGIDSPHIELRKTRRRDFEELHLVQDN